MKVEDVVATICSACISCYKDSCGRGSWGSGEVVKIPQLGKDTVCPLAALPANESSKKSFRDVSPADVREVCASCRYGITGLISQEDFYAHCLDCPCLSAREAIEEAAAEALVS